MEDEKIITKYEAIGVSKSKENEVQVQKDKKLGKFFKKEESDSNKNSNPVKPYTEQFLELTKNNILNSEESNVRKGRDLLQTSATANLFEDQQFLEKYQEINKRQIVKDLEKTGEAEAIRNQAKIQKERNIKAEAYHKAFKPLFDDFLGIKEPFGIVAMVIMTVIMIIPYIILSAVFNIIRFIVDGINQVFTAISGFVKPAKVIASGIIYIAIGVFIVIMVAYGIEFFFELDVPFI